MNQDKGCLTDKTRIIESTATAISYLVTKAGQTAAGNIEHL